MKETVLVTGAAGFIGTHVCEALLAQGNQVFGLDDFSTGTRRRNVPYELVQGSILDQEAQKLVDQLKPRVIVHLAALTGTRRSHLETQRYLNVNIMGSQAMMDAAVRVGARFVFASTSSVYGKLKSPSTEDAACAEPSWKYPSSHWRRRSRTSRQLRHYFRYQSMKQLKL